MPAPLRLIRGLSEIATDYDSLICDVWGVLHNGKQAQPAAWEACIRFREMGKPVILFSNAPRLAGEVKKQLDKMGVPQVAYDDIVTSGAVTRAELEKRTRAHTLRLLHIGPERDHSVYQGLNVSMVGASEAELVLCTGFYDDEKEKPEDYRARFAPLIARKLTLLCVNPDIVVQRGEKLIYCAGALARLYEQMGGKIEYYGKPHLPIYAAALTRARDVGRAMRPLVVGDGLETDIKGANTANLDALFVMDGVFAAEISDKRNVAAITKLLNAKGVTARYAIEALRW